MKHRKITNFALITLAFIAAQCLPVLAQPQPNLNRSGRESVQRLPNGNYFYGTSRSPYQSNTDYLIFRKTGNTIIGMRYPVPGETTCFRGSLSSGRITNVVIRFEPLGVGGERGEFRRSNPINLSSYYRLRVEQAPNFARRGLQDCMRVFSNRR